MRRKWSKQAGWISLLGLALAGAIWFAWPRPIPVDLGAVTRGPMEVTVDDDGKTNVRHIYTISAPISGIVQRISHPTGDQGPSLHVGDAVTANETVVAVMRPTTPSFIDIRSREELLAAVAAADAGVKQAEAEVQRVEASLNFSRTELQRAQSLARTQYISTQAVDKAKFEVQTNEAALASANAQLDVQRRTRGSLAARLIEPTDSAAPPSVSCCIQIRAPVSGEVLRIVQESEAVVQAGAPLIEIGDPHDLEVVADLLSTDAVQIQPEAHVTIDGWGGPPLQGRVKRVDPAGFLKISALGIEEQRVRTTIDFADPPDQWSRLGHDYRVVVHVTIWSADNVLTIPVGALFRLGEDWAVFSVKGGRAHATPVKIGHRNIRTAEVISGLSDGDQVVLHPSDRVRDGASVGARDGI